MRFQVVEGTGNRVGKARAHRTWDLRLSCLSGESRSRFVLEVRMGGGRADIGIGCSWVL